MDTITKMRELWPGKSDAWYEDAAENLRRYVTLAVEIAKDQ